MWVKLKPLSISEYRTRQEFKTIGRFIWYAPRKISVYEEISFSYLFDDLLQSFPLSHLKFYSITDWTKVNTPDIEGVLPLSKLPRTLAYIEFGNRFNTPIQENDLPASLTHCTFGAIFNQNVDHLPLYLVHLIFGEYFNKTVDRLPPKVRYIEFGVNFRHTIDCLPASVTSVCFSDSRFNAPINSLPSAMTHLELGVNFNQIIDCLPGILPPNLTYLFLGLGFNQTIDKLPPRLTHLNLDAMAFNHPINHLPPHLTHLKLPGFFNQSLQNLPPSLTHLRVVGYFDQPLPLHLNLQKISVQYSREPRRLLDSLHQFQQQHPNVEIDVHPVGSGPNRGQMKKKKANWEEESLGTLIL